ncbi:MAG TPA: sigma-70 family RNA polymerase sigma factor [Blastocatellia bacterium]|nr:sigma-70 family RNA polymerase sigma factor [Blastocatellia bacterium]
MTEDERGLWARYREGDETARRDLLLRYLWLVEPLASRIARSVGWTDWRDLKQDGVVGLMQAMKRFDPDRGVPFASFARPYVRGAIFDSPELTRDLARRQHESFRRIKEADAELRQTLGRQPTRAEVAAKTGLSEEQIRNAIAAVGLAFAAEPADADGAAPVAENQAAQLEVTILVGEVLAQLGETEAQIIIAYFLVGQSSQEIGQQLGLTVENVRKIRQRALGKLRRLLSGKEEGGPDENQ